MILNRLQTISDQLSILIIEDNAIDLFLIEEMLTSCSPNIKIYTADRMSTGCALLLQHDISLVLLDLSLPDTFGIASFLKLKHISKKIAVIILTGLADSEVAFEAIRQGAQDYLVKGEFKSDILIKSIQYSIERKNAEEQLIMSEEKYRQMFYKNPFPAIIYDLDTLRIMEVNDVAIQKYGYEKEEFLNLTIEDIRQQDEIPNLRQAIANLSMIHQMPGKLWRHKAKNGDIILAEVTWYQIDYFGKTAIQVQINDVTEKIMLEKELAEQQKTKQLQITNAVMIAQEKERKGIGEELHDNINQILAIAKLFLTTDLPQTNREFISKSHDYISLAMEEIRKLSFALITPSFTESGLKISIESLIENILSAKKIDITIDMGIKDEYGLCDDIKLTIYRIIQEQLNNILKYAEASAISIIVNTEDDKVCLSITDNGIGFDTSLHRKGIGITNINSRAEIYNGQVEIDSSPANGCRLTVVLHKGKIMSQRAA